MNDTPYVDKKSRVYKYGEFFPLEMSPFGYNETTAQEFFPLSKEESKEKEFNWRDLEERDYRITLQPDSLPNIEDAKDSTAEEIIGCFHSAKCSHQCSTAFRIIPEELNFYRKMKIPLPQLCPNCRHGERLKQRNPFKLWNRQCMKEGCDNEFETSYAPDRPEIVYCESCYNQEVA